MIHNIITYGMIFDKHFLNCFLCSIESHNFKYYENLQKGPSGNEGLAGAKGIIVRTFSISNLS